MLDVDCCINAIFAMLGAEISQQGFLVVWIDGELNVIHAHQVLDYLFVDVVQGVLLD